MAEVGVGGEVGARAGPHDAAFFDDQVPVGEAGEGCTSENRDNPGELPELTRSGPFTGTGFRLVVSTTARTDGYPCSSDLSLRGVADMAGDPFYKEHWVNIDQDRLDRYQRMFQWNPDSTALYESADIRLGHTVGDFGCGPGHIAVEIAKWVGRDGHVHALDINAEFIASTKDKATAAGFDERITTHQCDGSVLPLPDSSLDRLTTRNTMIYVDDAEETIREFRRVLRTGGKAHVIEGDWPMMIVEPVRSKDWAALVDAASRACRTPNIGRKLYGLMGLAGFTEIDVQVLTHPDTDGRIFPMIKNMAGYARGSGKMSEADIDKILSTIEQAVSDGSYLALAPQFIVTATR